MASGTLVLKTLSLLRRVGAATNEWQRTTIDAGFTVNQALVLHYLVVHGDASPSELADWMHITRGSVTPTVKRLEDLGLVTRRIDDADGRKQWLSATTEAHEINAEVETTVLGPVRRALSPWSKAELERLTNGLERLLDSDLFGGKA